MARSETLRVVEYHAYANKPFLRSNLVGSIGNPVLFLAAMGVGLGSLIEGEVGGVDYLTFVGSGLLAATSMQVAANESTFPVMAGIKWIRFYRAIVASPIGVEALVAGKLAWTALRLAVGSAIYLVVLALFGAIASPATAVLAIPASTLCGLAFAAPIAAFSSTQENDQWFTAGFRIVIMPLFLFSGTFFPVEQLPAALEAAARYTPLWHGVQLTRGAILGDLALDAAVIHVAYLSTFVFAGWLVARRTFRRRLVG